MAKAPSYNFVTFVVRRWKDQFLRGSLLFLYGFFFPFQAAAPQKEDVKKAIFGQKKNLLTPRGPIPKKTSSGGRRKKRFSASENHFCKPLPPKAPALREKNGFRQAKITFSSPYPFQGTSYGRRAPTWRKLEKTILANKNHISHGVAFPSTNFADTSERMTFSKQKQSFQILAPSNHQLWKNKHQTIFWIRNSFTPSIFI